MVKTTINISFEIEDSWNLDHFRSFIKLLLSDDKFDVFIISNNDDSNMITSVGYSLGLPESNIIICNFTDDKLEAIQNKQIDIHFDNLQSFIMMVDETTDARGILVTPFLNKFYLKADFILTFERILKEIESESQT